MQRCDQQQRPTNKNRRVRLVSILTLCPLVALSPLLALGLLVVLPLVPPVFGQSVDQLLGAHNVSAVVEEAKRDRQYEQLARDVAAFELQLGLVRRAVQLVTPSVVHIEARPMFERHVRVDVQEAGSGVVVKLGDQPYVLTNRHVIKNSSAPHVRIQLASGEVLHPQRIWSDPETDVAVMQVAASDLVCARVGDSNAAQIGDLVLAMGSPFGLSRSVTRGIISARGRYNLDLGDGEVLYQNFLQTDAAINPGNSGGPLINLRGEVIGLNTAIASNSGGNEGIGFSIPIHIAIRIAQDLANIGKVTRGYLGVTLDGGFDERFARSLGLPRVVGARVKAVQENSPAARAQLQVDDVVMTYNGIRVEDDDHLISLVKLTAVGHHIPLGIYRDRKIERVMVEIGTE